MSESKRDELGESVNKPVASIMEQSALNYMADCVVNIARTDIQGAFR